jgi:hypothetical protein
VSVEQWLSYLGTMPHDVAATVGGFASHSRSVLTTAISRRDEEALGSLAKLARFFNDDHDQAATARLSNMIGHYGRDTVSDAS